MTIEPYGNSQRYESIRVENDRERTAKDAITIATKRYPDADRIVITGRNGAFLFEEHLRRSDGTWIDKHLPPEKPALSMHRVISYFVRRLFP